MAAPAGRRAASGSGSAEGSPFPPNGYPAVEPSPFPEPGAYRAARSRSGPPTGSQPVVVDYRGPRTGPQPVVVDSSPFPQPGAYRAAGRRSGPWTGSQPVVDHPGPRTGPQPVVVDHPEMPGRYGRHTGSFPAVGEVVVPDPELPSVEASATTATTRASGSRAAARSHHSASGSRRSATGPRGSTAATRPERARHRDATRAAHWPGRGVAVTTTRTVVVLGLVAAGYTEVKAAGPLADVAAQEAAPAADQVAANAQALFQSPLRTAFLDETVLLRGASQVLEQRVQAEVAAAKARAAAKAKADAAAQAATKARAAALTTATRNAIRNPKAVARLLVAGRGWSTTQFTCLDLLWTKESGWNYRATNPSSGAFGIPQALPAGKMASAGSDWRTNPVTQMKWGLSYIAGVYGTPCGAWSHSKAFGWY